MTVASAVNALLDTLDLDERGETNAEIARALATKLDQAVGDTKGDVAIAISAIAKELRAVVDALLETAHGSDDFVAGLFAEMGNPSDT
ncbi:MAG: hypothetical protein ACLP1E_08700 [Acidimicrobiales bacterium]